MKQLKPELISSSSRCPGLHSLRMEYSLPPASSLPVANPSPRSRGSWQPWLTWPSAQIELASQLWVISKFKKEEHKWWPPVLSAVWMVWVTRSPTQSGASLSCFYSPPRPTVWGHRCCSLLSVTWVLVHTLRAPKLVSGQCTPFLFSLLALI